MSHTPGPWKLDSRDWPLIINGQEETEPNIVAVLESSDKSKGLSIENNFFYLAKTQLANARLISAAPELLDALIELADHVNKLEGDRKCSAVWMRAKALIKKAKGEYT